MGTTLNFNRNHQTKCIHRKTGNTYYLIGLAVNATNGDQDGLNYALYQNEKGELFVRDWAEFSDKFSLPEDE